MQLGHIWKFLLHIFDQFVYESWTKCEQVIQNGCNLYGRFPGSLCKIVPIFSWAASHLFAEYSAEIVIVIITHQKRNRLQFLILIFHKFCCFFHTDPGEKGNDRLPVFLAENSGEIAGIHMVLLCQSGKCNILVVRTFHISVNLFYLLHDGTGIRVRASVLSTLP